MVKISNRIVSSVALQVPQPLAFHSLLTVSIMLSMAHECVCRPTKSQIRQKIILCPNY